MRRSRTRVVILARLSWRSRLLILGAVLAGYGIWSAISNPPWWVDLFTALLGVSMAVNEIVRARNERRAVYFLKRVEDSYDDVLPGLAQTGRPINSGSGDGILLFAESSALRAGTVEAKVSPTDYQGRRELSQWSLAFLSREYRGSTFFNGDVVGIEDWSTAGAAGPGLVTLRGCGYFDFISTNLLAQYDVRMDDDGDDERVIVSGRQLILDRFGELRDFGKSWLANTVGVSTLAFSSDGKLLLVQQTPKNIGSPGLRAPSGSGALEKKDLPVTADLVALQSIISKGAARELAEECHLSPDEIETDGTSVIAFGRWLTRGAMPEFSCVTLLTKEGSEIARRSVRASEVDYIQGVIAIRLTPISEWEADRPESLLPVGQRTALSYPLLMALSGLADAIQDPDWAPGAELRRRLHQ